MKQYPFLDLRLANEPFEKELEQAACDVVKSGRYLHGQYTERLESEIARLCQTKYCVAVSNGLDALRLILRAYREMGVIGDGDKVIVPANTYVATVLAVSDNNLQPCLCDVRPDTMNLDSDLLESLLSPSVKAIMPVHLYGTPCWSEKLKNMATHYGIKIIEDNAQAIGAEAHLPGLNGCLTTGGLGDAAAISFYPTKNLGALGDGGAVTTNDEALARTVRTIANYGADYRYHNIYQGLNCRIDEIQAAFLLVKLKHLQEENDRRRKVAQAYSETIDTPLVKAPTIFGDMKQVWHQYVVRAQNRDKFRDYLSDNGVMTDIHYAVPPHKQPCYQEFKSRKLPVTTTLADEIVSLPIAHPITTESARDIARIINNYQG